MTNNKFYFEMTTRYLIQVFLRSNQTLAQRLNINK